LLRKATSEQLTVAMSIRNSFSLGNCSEKVIIQGSAGTGKSFTLMLIQQTLTNYLDKLRGGSEPEAIRVLVTAPTGKAAFLVGGITCHSAFSLPTKREFHRPDLAKLGSDTANSLRCALKNVEIVIIDEYSMLSYVQFIQIDKRMQQIFANDEPFGGKCIILVGDPLQLNPVKGTPIYDPPKNVSSLDYVAGLIYQDFKLFELTIVKRQTDLQFIEALNNCAISKMTEDDVSYINGRVREDHEVPKSATRLYHSNQDANNYNKKKIAEAPGILYIVKALDSLDTKSLKQSETDEILEKYQDREVADTNVPYEISIKIGIKYVVVKNVQQSDGIVNGAVGRLEHITFDPKNDSECQVLWIQFEDARVGAKARSKWNEFMKSHNIPERCTPIEKDISTMTSSKKYLRVHEAFRKQFPVQPAEAMTIHKSQGSTIKEVCLDLTKASHLTATLKYVALSRCDYDGLYIIGKFEKPPQRLTKSKNLLEIERLRAEAPYKTSFYNFDRKKGFIVIYVPQCELIQSTQK
jgi:ATP-dependent exoDNAse (exonuclease V) alpha subunit